MDEKQLCAFKSIFNKYQNIIDNHILPDLGDIKIYNITSTMINNFLAKKMKSGRLDCKGGLSSSYVKSIMLIINSSINFAVEEQFCKPLKNRINKPILFKKEITILNKIEQNKLEEELLINLDTTRLNILISLHAGLRIGEVCALTWDNIDLENRVIKVRHTISRIKNNDGNSKYATSLIIDTPKTKASIRDIPISSYLMRIFLKFFKKQSSDFIISNKQSFINPMTFEYRYHKIFKICGISNVNYHALRHTFATRCVEAGVYIKSLSEILGHSNVGITLNTYVHSSLELKRKQIEKLNKVLS